MRPSRILPALALELLITFGVSHGQTWTKVANGLFVGHRDNGAAMCYEHGKLWAGYDLLYCSTDLGATWVQRKLAGYDMIHNIAFGDALHGYCLRYNVLYRTVDGGDTWTQASSMSGAQGLDCSPNGKQVYVVTSGGALWKSTDYGQSWVSTSIASSGDRFIGDVMVSPTGVVRLVAGFKPTTRLMTSLDGGITWQSSTAGQGDTWSGAMDSCGGESIYLANENYWARQGTKSNIFRSTDGASTWQATLTIDGPGLNGSIAVGAGLVAAQSLQQGVYLSSDKGKNWTMIGGPAEGQDSRAIVILPDASVFCQSDVGDIWRYTPKADPLPSRLFAFDTLSACLDSVARSLVVTSNVCSRRFVDFRIAGADSGAYVLHQDKTKTGADSLTIVFMPIHDGPNAARLVLTMDDGSVSYCDLQGNGYGGITIDPQIQSSVATVAIGEEILVPLDLTFNQPVANVSFSVRWDTSSFVYEGTTLAEGLALDSPPFKQTGEVALKVPAGYLGQHIVAQSRFACFPRYGLSTEIHFDSVSWTARTGGCLSMLDTSFSTPVTFPTTCGQRFLSDFLRYGASPILNVRPNPAHSEITVSVRNLNDYSIQLSNLAGSTLLQKAFERSGDFPMSLDALPKGSYIVSLLDSRGILRSQIISKE